MWLVKRGITKIVSDGIIEFFTSAIRYIIRKASRSHLYFQIKTKLCHRRNGYTAIADPFKIIYIDPSDVVLCSSEFRKWESVGMVRGGDWDKQATHISDIAKYQAVKSHFCNDVSWEDTGIIDNLFNTLLEEERESIDGCKDRSEIKERYEQIDNLYQNMKESGYQEKKHGSKDYVAVHIGRDGEFLFAGSGHHRLGITKILDFGQIPVWVRARHKKWQVLRDDIYHNGLSEGHGEKIRNHPDLQDIIN